MTDRIADGGGVRGVSSLLILDELMNRIKEQYELDEVPKPCDYFHMIAGTSTGGWVYNQHVLFFGDN